VTSPEVPKQKISDLAIFGGGVSFPKPLIVGRPNIPDVDAVADDIREILLSGWLSNNGPFVRRFEEEIGRISETDHCVVTCNATAALELMCRALGLEGEVIVPSFTFIATAHALAWQGLTPVFVDVDPVTHTIDPAGVEAAITSSTSAICGVHLWGNVCDVESLQEIADRHGLALWFDAAHAFSISRGNEKIGNFGRAEVFSFHATKFVNAFEGGAIVTNDSELAHTLRGMRNFGFRGNRAVAQLGINAKMSEASAAMGLRSLECLDRIQSQNRCNYDRYYELLTPCKGVRMSAPLDPDGSNCQYVVIEIDAREVGISRNLILMILEAEGVLIQRYFYPGCHLATPYREGHRSRNIRLPATERLAQTVIQLPTGTGVSMEDLERVCALIKFVIDSSLEIRDELKSRELKLQDSGRYVASTGAPELRT